jgi:DNA polymerase-3 subunit delta'
MDFLSANTMPWLSGAQGSLRAARATGRMPHSLLILSTPGLGAESLARWSGAFVLCDAPSGQPCGQCGACRLLASGTHPDIHLVELEEKAQQIKIEQVRELIEALTLKSYRGGYKVGIIDAAELLNANGANAFLKTLEEPTSGTLLILVAQPNHRLPATIASRCMRLTLRAPPREAAERWLNQQGAAPQSWDAALTLTGGAPLLALACDPAMVKSLDEEMRRDLAQLAAGHADLSLTAERWLRSEPQLRLRWLENWITWRVQVALIGEASAQSAEPVRLPAALLKPKIRPLFALLDATRDFRRLAPTSMNQQLALEALLIEGKTAFGP